ncbi:MAG: DUF3782 domain-containing protein [Aigarchaeota archaeon]|nr:DUF3782 domain-containing protein [Candidatus Pelearchaeum maunauluense]
MSIKDEFLSLLERDKEFRYAVAGLLGLEEILKRLDRHEEELVKLREDMNKLREDMNKLREDMNKLREDMNRGFALVERHITALGARWGLLTENAFREGLRDLLEKELGLKVEKWSRFDERGMVFGYPSLVEIDVAIRDDRIILVEVKSHVGAGDVYSFKRKGEFYAANEGKKPDRLVIVTPYADAKAVEAARHLGIEVHTKI